MLRRHRGHNGKADGHEAAYETLEGAENENLPGRRGEARGQGRQEHRGEDDGHDHLRPPPVCLDRPERSGQSDHEGGDPGNKARPECRFPGVRQSQFRQEEWQERHDAHHGNAGAYLDGADKVYDGFPAFQRDPSFLM